MHAGSASANATSGRYAIFGEIASGGMATIQYGRAVGVGGFSRPVVIKRLHPQFAKDPTFVSMFLDEARLSARIAHANVVSTLDVMSEPDALGVVMEYVHGESLARLMQRVRERGERLPPRIAVTLMVGVLHGLHAAHETCGEHGEPLHIVHRDVSPDNILVGSDGVPRLIDFGIARARGRSRVTPAGELKGKLAYMAAEQFLGHEVDRRVDVYGAAVVLWEALVGRELFTGESDAALVGAVMSDPIEPPSHAVPELPEALDRIVMRGLSRDRDQRFPSAREMALALERDVGVATQSEVSDWLEHEVGALLAERAEKLRQLRAPSDATATTSDEPPGTRRVPASITPTRRADVALTEPWSATPTGLRGGSGMRRRPTARRGTLGALAFLLLGLALGVSIWLPRRGTTPADDARDTATPPAVATPPSAAPTLVRDEAPPHGDDTSARPEQSAAEAVKPAADAPDASAPREAKAGEVPPPPPAADAPDPGDRPADRGSDARAKSDPTGKTRSRDSERKKKPEVDCSDPFTVDARGIRHVKRACL